MSKAILIKGDLSKIIKEVEKLGYVPNKIKNPSFVVLDSESKSWYFSNSNQGFKTGLINEDENKYDLYKNTKYGYFVRFQSKKSDKTFYGVRVEFDGERWKPVDGPRVYSYKFMRKRNLKPIKTK